jgi:periplasmic divalent cation tolerance protein
MIGYAKIFFKLYRIDIETEATQTAIEDVMKKTVVLYITCKTNDEARAIGRTLVSERLVACVNILPPIQSLYWWNDEIQEDTETAFYAKTTDENVEKVISLVKKRHSYDCPCIIAMPIEKGNPDYLKWIEKETQKSTF